MRLKRHTIQTHKQQLTLQSMLHQYLTRNILRTTYDHNNFILYTVRKLCYAEGNVLFYANAWKYKDERKNWFL
jgi:hypothetical protein